MLQKLLSKKSILNLLRKDPNKIFYGGRHTLHCEIIIRDGKTGEIEQQIPAQSLLKQFIQILYTQMAQTAMNILDVTGTPRAISQDLENFQVNGRVASSYGIRVGTGTNAVTINDVALQTIIANGIGAGQLSHQPNAVSVPVVLSPDAYVDVTRQFDNNSGGDITVNEVALYTTINGFLHCFDRTLSSFTIANTASKIITYRIKVTV